MYLNIAMAVASESLEVVLERLERGISRKFDERDSFYLGAYWRACAAAWEVQVCDAVLPDGEPVHGGSAEFSLVIRAEGDFPDEIHTFLEELAGRLSKSRC